MSSDFYYKYHRLFYEEEPEPVSLQYFLSKNPKNHINVQPTSDIMTLAQHYNIIPKEGIEFKREKPVQKHGVSQAIEQPPQPVYPKSFSKLPFNDSPNISYKPTPIFTEPKKPIIEYQPQPDKTEDVFKSLYAKQTSSPQFQSIPQQQIHENTRGNIFPEAIRPQSKPINPYQAAINRRKDAKKSNEYRKERLRELLSMDRVPLGKLNR